MCLAVRARCLFFMIPFVEHSAATRKYSLFSGVTSGEYPGKHAEFFVNLA